LRSPRIAVEEYWQYTYFERGFIAGNPQDVVAFEAFVMPPA
jgi:hypothetical protein